MRQVKNGCIIEDVSFRISSMLAKCKYDNKPYMKERVYDILMDYMFADRQYEKCYAVMRAKRAMAYSGEEIYQHLFHLLFNDYQACIGFGDFESDANRFKIYIEEVD